MKGDKFSFFFIIKFILCNCQNFFDSKLLQDLGKLWNLSISSKYSIALLTVFQSSYVPSHWESCLWLGLLVQCYRGCLPCVGLLVSSTSIHLGALERVYHLKKNSMFSLFRMGMVSLITDFSTSRPKVGSVCSSTTALGAKRSNLTKVTLVFF